MTRARILYIPDFKYTVIATGETEHAELKGFKTPEFNLKKKLWAAGYGPGVLKIYNSQGGRIVLVETIIPKRSDENG